MTISTPLATTHRAGNLAELIASAAENVVGDQHRAALFQPPNRPAVRELAMLRLDVCGKHVFFSLGQLQLIGGGEPSSTERLSYFLSFLSPSFLSLLFGPEGKRLIEFRGYASAKRLLQLLDPLVCGIEFFSQRHDQANQPIATDPPFPHILFESLNIHPPVIINPPKSSSADFTE